MASRFFSEDPLPSLGDVDRVLLDASESRALLQWSAGVHERDTLLSKLLAIRACFSQAAVQQQSQTSVEMAAPDEEPDAVLARCLRINLAVCKLE
ncbi:hypothetical protein DIPPA_20949 [Diplonema papillatum]|nr:hypothetical protein DIPPA_20949 [Diplonema papillatum]